MNIPTGFRWFSKIFASLCFWTKEATALEGLRNLWNKIEGNLGSHSSLSCIRVPLKIVIWVNVTFDNNTGIKNGCTKYNLKESSSGLGANSGP